ncbi:hypothetical protein CEXT_553791, partial [Caerostris extrusa]
MCLYSLNHMDEVVRTHNVNGNNIEGLIKSGESKDGAKVSTTHVNRAG